MKGVCAGLAHYFDVPVRLIRVMVVLSLFFGLFFFTLVAYIALVFVLDEAPASRFEGEHQKTPRQLLDQLEYELGSGEQQLRQVERYVTSGYLRRTEPFPQAVTLLAIPGLHRPGIFAAVIP